MLGSRYVGSPIIVPDGGEAPAEHYANYQPSSCPGCLAPHAWLQDGASLYDRFGPGYTLLVLGGGASVAAFEHAARETGTPLTVLRSNDPALHALYGAQLTLIRPDQYVAWRGSDGAAAMNIIATLTGEAVAHAL